MSRVNNYVELFKHFLCPVYMMLVWILIQMFDTVADKKLITLLIEWMSKTI